MQATMPLSDRDPNTSGRNSRASHLSTGSKGAVRRSHPSQQQHTIHHGFGPKNRASDGMLSAAPGVMGMLRTTMEIGDVASLALPSNRSKPAPHYGHGYHRGYNRRSGATSRMSGGSANSQPFDGPRHRGWPSVSSAGRRRSITSNVTAPPFLEPGPAPPSSIGSYSFVTMGDRPESPPMLPYGRPVSRPVSISGRSLSMTSNSTPHGHSLANYRSLSSLRGSGQREGYPRPQSPFHYPTRLKRPGYRPSSPALSDVTGGNSSKHLHVSRPSRSRAQPAPPTIVTPRHPAPYPTHRNRSAPAVATMLNTPILKGGPYGHPRDDTPSLSDGSVHRARPSGSYKHSLSIRSNRSTALPSSSDPPSSSNPPTPRDSGYVNPMIVAAHSSTSVANKGLMPPNAPVAYYDYTEDYELEKEVTEVFNETLPDSPMPFGFLERIKAILEERERSANGTMSPDSSDMGMPRDSMNDSMPPGLVELPATPVGARRITRELIMAALAPSSDSLGPDSAIETVTSMISTPTLADCSLAVEPSSTPDDSDVEDYHSVASRVPSHHSRRSQARLPLDVFSTHHRLNNRSSQSLASFVPDEFDKNIPPVPQLPLRLSPIRPPPVIPAANELIIDKVKRHWSLRRAALGPAGTVETVSHRFVPMKAPTIPPITSSASHKSQNSSATVDVDAIISHERRISHDTMPISQRVIMESLQANRTNAGPIHAVASADQLCGKAESELGHLGTSAPFQSRIFSVTPSSPLSFQDIGVEEYAISETQNNITGAENTSWTYRKHVTVNSRGSNTALSESYVKESGTDLTKSEGKIGHVRASNSTQLPDVQEEPGLESSTDLRRSSFIFPIGKRPGSAKPLLDNSRALSGVKTFVESIRSLKEHRASTGSGSIRGTMESLKSAREHQPSNGSGSMKGPVENIRSGRPSTGSGSFKTPLDAIKSREHRPSTGGISLKAPAENTRAIHEHRRPFPGGSFSKINNAGSHSHERQKSKDSVIMNKLKEIPTLVLPTPRAPSQVFKQPSSGLLDTHAIPSLNFSSINLISRLNDALELRRASLGSDFANLMLPASGSPKRHSTSTIIREKYRSIFLSFDDMAASRDQFIDFADSPENTELNVFADEIFRPGSEQPHLSALRPLSPAEFLDELERISVPSVNGLTQRLSELLPSLRRHFSETGEDSDLQDPIENTINEIRELGKIASAEEQQIPIMEMDWRKSLHIRSRSMNDQLRVQNSWPSRPVSVPPPELSELPGSFSFAHPGRLRSLSDSEVDWSLIERINRLARNSNRELKGLSPSPRDPRPWNLESSYPWSNSVPFFDIQFPVTPSNGTPSPVPRKASPYRPSQLRLLSNDTSEVAETTEASSIGLPGPLTSNPATHGLTSRQSPLPAATTHRRHHRKTGLLGSISQRVFQKSGLASGIALSETSTLNVSGRRTLLTEGTDRAVDPGDRYPITALSPPSALNLDDVHSFFSDDSNASQRQREQRTRGGSFRKRLTSSLRARLPSSSRSIHKASSTMSRHQRVSTHTILIPSSDPVSEPQDVQSVPPPACMSRTEVKAKKLVDRLKTILWRSGELLRSMSHRKSRRLVDQDEHWSENGESLQDLRVPVGVTSGEYDAGRTAMARDIRSTRSSLRHQSGHGKNRAPSLP